MKGIARELILVMIIVIGAYSISFSATLSSSQEKIRAEMFREDSYTMDDALLTAKKYTETSLAYSVYQACYENLLRGGWETIPEEKSETLNNIEYAYWFNNEDISPDEVIFTENLERETESNMKTYTNEKYRFLYNYYVEFPEYEINAEKEDGNVKLTLTSNEKMSITKYDEGRKATIKRSLPESETVDINCFGIFEKGKEKGEELFNELLNVMKSEIDPLPKTHFLDRDATCDEVYQGLAGKSISDKEEEIKTSIENSSGIKLEVKEDNYLIKTEVVQADVNIDVGGMFKAKDDNGNVIKTNCDFSYKANVTLNVTITDDSGKAYPVWDDYEKTIAFRPLSLVFLVKEGYELQ